jgi:NADH-ubiquinone oxidoreductase chain 2
MFNGLFYLENYSIFFISFILIISILILLITSYYPRKFNSFNKKNVKTIKNISLKNKNISNILNNLFINKNSEQFRLLEYPLLLIFCISGTIFLISSSDIISIFLAIELQSYSLYLISAIYRNSEYSVGASLMYFLLGSLSSCLILLGISLLYIIIGNTNLENIFIINNIYTTCNFSDIFIPLIISENLFNNYFYMQLAIIIMSIGFLFKISAAPFHF